MLVSLIILMLTLHAAHIGGAPSAVQRVAKPTVISGQYSVLDNNVDWQPLREAIDQFRDVESVVVLLGNGSGLLFEHVKGDITPQTRMPVASATKWLGSVLLVSLVEAGIMGLDDPVHKWLSFWPDATADSRSWITLRHCLAFTTGYVDDSGGGMGCLGLGTLDCAKLVLDTKPHEHPAGTHLDYNSEHYRIAAAMAVAAAGRPLMELIEDHIFERTLPPMRSTTFNDPGNPNLASEMTTTAEDYQAFFSSYFNGVLVSRAARRAMESDQCPSCSACEFCKKRGHYSMGNWNGCLGWGLADPTDPASAPLPNPAWTIGCATADEHWSSGFFGYWPETVTSELDYYFHMAMYGPGSDTAGRLKQQLKPVMDRLLGGADRWPSPPGVHLAP